VLRAKGEKELYNVSGIESTLVTLDISLEQPISLSACLLEAMIRWTNTIAVSGDFIHPSDLDILLQQSYHYCASLSLSASPNICLTILRIP
jgi:hypothetical protein